MRYIAYQDRPDTKPRPWCLIEEDGSEDGRLVASELTKADAHNIARVMSGNYSVNKLQDENEGPNGTWGEHPDYPVSDWQSEVGGGGQSYCDTRQGYWEWVYDQLEQAEENNEQ
jgi:hypothetical protein